MSQRIAVLTRSVEELGLFTSVVEILGTFPASVDESFNLNHIRIVHDVLLERPGIIEPINRSSFLVAVMHHCTDLSVR